MDAGDFDADGDDDLAVLTSRDVRVYFQEENRLVERAILVEEGRDSLEVGDLNGDGMDDVLSGAGPDNRVWYGPDFSASRQVNARGEIVGDVDGNGRSDVMWDRGFSYQVEDGVFASAAPFWPSFFPDDWASGDLNEDGRVDHVAMWSIFGAGGIGETVGGIGVRLQRPDGRFGPLKVSGLLGANVVRTGDATGDGRDDVIVGEFHGGVTFLHAKAGGALGPACTLADRKRGDSVRDVEVLRRSEGRGPLILATRNRQLLTLDLR